MQLEDYISAGRLNIYTDVLKLKPGEELGGYNWNKAVSAAMQPLMHCLEVTLRNAIDYSIRHARLPGAAGHWRTDTNWIFDLPRYIGDKTWIRQNKRYKTDARGQKLMRHGKPVYDRTAWEEDCIRKVSKRIRAAGKAPTAERVISGLDFGFWTNFLTKNYDEPRNRSLLWPQLLPSVFPGAPAGTPVTCWKRNLPVSVTCVTAWRTMKQSGNSRRKIRLPVRRITTARYMVFRRPCSCCVGHGKICWRLSAGSVLQGMLRFWQKVIICVSRHWPRTMVC
jgi:hypothetical protein